MKRARESLRTATWGALPIWIGTRALVVLIALGGMTLTFDRQAHDIPTFLSLWERWDVGWFRDLARYGYFDRRMPDPNGAAFFPGMPLAMRVAHVVIGNWVVAGLAISLIAGAVASIALHRLAAEERGATAGNRAVLYWALSPYALFLFAGYSEALFCAFAFSAWLAARHERWAAAGLLAAGAAATRISGIPFAIALVVQYVVQRAKRGGWRAVVRPEAAWLAAPAVSVAAYFAYLHSHTGRWLEYSYALQRGWGRQVVSPLVGLRASWAQALNPDQPSNLQWAWRGEVVAVVGGVLLALVLLWLRRWGEATFVGLSALMLSASSYYTSTVRALLLWFPLYLLLARLTARHDTAHVALVSASATVMGLFVLTFTRGAWVG